MTETRKRFALGAVRMTAEASAKLRPEDIQEALEGHARGSWGQVDDLTRHDNDQAVFFAAGSIHSVYIDPAGNRIAVSTNCDHTATTVAIEEEPDFD